MRRSLLTLSGWLLASVLAHAQHLYFTTMIPAGCPIVIEGITHSREFGFQAAVFHNDSEQTVEALYLKVTLSSPGGEEQIVDSGHIFIEIDPGDRKSQDMFLGRMDSLNQRIKYDHLEVARAMISVESVEFADGSRWTADGPVNFEPTDPLPVIPLLPPR